MKRTALIGSLTLAAGVAHGGLVDPALDAVLREADPDEVVSVLVFHVDQVEFGALSARLDADRASMRERHEVVVRALQANATFNGAALGASANIRENRTSCESPVSLATVS